MANYAWWHYTTKVYHMTADLLTYALDHSLMQYPCGRIYNKFSIIDIGDLIKLVVYM